MSQPSLSQIIKSASKARPSCTPALIESVRGQLIQPSIHSLDISQMHRYLQWRLHVSSRQLDAILLGLFVSVYADELLEKADEV